MWGVSRLTDPSPSPSSGTVCGVASRSAAPGWPLERPLVGRAVIHGLAVRHDHALERKLEQPTQRGKHALLVRWRGPDAKVAVRCGQCVREHQGPLLGQPERCLVAATTVVQGHETPRELAPRLYRLQLRLRDVVAPKEPRAEGAGAVAPHEDIDVSDMVWFEDDDDRRRARVKPPPCRVRVGGRRHRIEQRDLTTRLDARRGNMWPPIETGTPVG